MISAIARSLLVLMSVVSVQSYINKCCGWPSKQLAYPNEEAAMGCIYCACILRCAAPHAFRLHFDDIRT